MARQLLLIRHATVPTEFVGRYVGRTDLPVGPNAAAQLAPLAAWLRAKNPGVCRVSPRLRTRQTADLLAGECPGLRLRIDEDLREVDFGEWETRTFAEIAAGYPADVERWAAGGDDFVFPGGERLGDFHARVAAATQRLVSDPADLVTAVTHGGVIRQMICELLALDCRSYMVLDVRNAAATVIDLYGGKGVLTGFNLPGGGEGR